MMQAIQRMIICPSMTSARQPTAVNVYEQQRLTPTPYFTTWAIHKGATVCSLLTRRPGPKRDRGKSAVYANSSDEAPSTDSNLDLFLAWIMANGVTGMGRTVGIFQGEDGERGLTALQDVDPGTELLRIPLRIALTDHPEDEESNSLLYANAPWSVRLAAKILREKAKGPQSVYRSYINVLPDNVPSPLTGFDWEEMQELQYQPVLTEVYETDWLAADAYSRCSPEAIGGASEEEFRWALSVVHSRTFGSASPMGGVGVRMLVPLVDMINHAGDWGGVVNGESDEQITPLDVAMWELVPPHAESEEWEMIVKAIRPIEESQEIVMSYGERDNHDFLVHYGFVPEANPHDSAQLFSAGPREAAEWFLQQAYASVDFTGSDMTDVQSLLADAAAAADAATPDEEDSNTEALCVLSNGRVNAKLLKVFEHLASKTGMAATTRETCDRIAARAVASRCVECLMDMKTSLAEDLADLASQHDATAPYNVELFKFLQRQHEVRLQKLEAAGELPPSSRKEHEQSASMRHSDSVEMSGPQALALQFRCYKKLLLWATVAKLGPAIDLQGLLRPSP